MATDPFDFLDGRAEIAPPPGTPAAPDIGDVPEYQDPYAFLGVAPGAVAPRPNVEARSAEAPRWGFVDQTLSGLGLGFGPTLRGTEDYLTGKAGNLSLGQSIFNAESEQSAYERQYPYAKPLEVAASIPTTIGINALTPGLSRLMTNPSLGIRAGGYTIAGMEDALAQQKITEGDLASNMLFGGAVNAALPYGGAIIGSAARAASKVDPGVVDLMGRLESLGVKLRPSQVSMSGALKKADELLASGGNDIQLRDFTRAVSRTFGEDTDRITPGVLSGAAQRIEQQMDSIAQQAQLTYSPTLAHGISLVGATRKGLQKAHQDQINEALSEITGAFVNGKMDGETYKRLVLDKGSVIRNLMNEGNTSVKQAGVRLKELLDDELEAASPPGVAEQWGEARSQLKNLLTVQPIMEGTVTGIVPPQKMHQQVRKFFHEYGWESLPAQMDTLAEGGRLMPRVDDTGEAIGTAKLPWWTKAGVLLPGAVGGGLLEYYVFSQSPKIAAAALAGAGITAVGKTAVKSFMGSDFYRNSLTGGIAAPGTFTSAASPAMISAVNLLRQPDADLGEAEAAGPSVPPALR